MKNKLGIGTINWFPLYLFLILFSITSINVYGQNKVSNSDSLLQASLKKAKTNDDSLDAYINVFNDRSAPEDKFDKYIAESESLLHKKAKNRTKCNLYLSIGNSFLNVNDVKKSTHYLEKALRIAEASVDSMSISRAYYALGRLNYYQGDMNLAIKYLMRNSLYSPSDIDVRSKATSLIALGTVYNDMEKYELADSVFHLMIHYSILAKEPIYTALGYITLGEIKSELNQIDSAFYYINKGKKINYEIDSKLGIAWSNFTEGQLYEKMGQWKKADKSIGIAISTWEELNSLTDLAYGYKEYAKIKGELGDYKQAYHYNIKDRTVNDSIRKKENIRHIQELEKKYQTEKDSLNLANVELQLDQEKIQRNLENVSAEKQLILFLFIGIVLVVNSIYFIYKLRVTKKAKSIIEQQHIALELKTKEITDSINYAKRIQNTLIPTFETLETHLPASFVFYRPKDIVAGDFYWLEQVGDWTFCAVADCTGHGVPGAMVSVVCANALNKIILEKGEKEPGKILDKVRNIVVDQFYKSGEGINDGMDISLCAFNFKTLEMNWSGANNPLWLIRDNELIEEKGDKQPIGKYIHNKSFKNHSFQLLKNDVIYLFTDGFADQFGGEDGKKLKNKYFKEWILSVHQEPMERQYALTDEYFDYWKGALEQLDDVCVMGIRII